MAFLAAAPLPLQVACMVLHLGPAHPDAALQLQVPHRAALLRGPLLQAMWVMWGAACMAPPHPALVLALLLQLQLGAPCMAPPHRAPVLALLQLGAACMAPPQQAPVLALLLQLQLGAACMAPHQQALVPAAVLPLASVLALPMPLSLELALAVPAQLLALLLMERLLELLLQLLLLLLELLLARPAWVAAALAAVLPRLWASPCAAAPSAVALWAGSSLVAFWALSPCLPVAGRSWRPGRPLKSGLGSPQP